METIHTPEARALADLQKRDTALDALKARAAAIPQKIKGVNAAFAGRKAEMLAAREAFLALQSRKKDLELKIAEAEEGIRKHQLQLNQVKDNAAFKALLADIAKGGAAVFMCTHILDMAEKLCHSVGIIYRGRLIARGTVDEVKRLTAAAGTHSLEDVFLELTE